MTFDQLISLKPHVDAIHAQHPCVDGHPSIDMVDDKYVTMRWKTALHGGQLGVNAKFVYNKDGVFTHAEVRISGEYLYRTELTKPTTGDDEKPDDHKRK